MREKDIEQEFEWKRKGISSRELKDGRGKKRRN